MFYRSYVYHCVVQKDSTNTHKTGGANTNPQTRSGQVIQALPPYIFIAAMKHVTSNKEESITKSTFETGFRPWNRL